MCRFQTEAPRFPCERSPWFPQLHIKFPKARPKTRNPTISCAKAKCAKATFARSKLAKAESAQAECAKGAKATCAEANFAKK